MKMDGYDRPQALGHDSISFQLSPMRNLLPADERAEMVRNAAFGKVFTEHMISIEWNTSCRWHSAQLRAHEALLLDPGTLVLHYGQSIFEGLKAYRQADGPIATFRPYANARRFRQSARRLAMPELPEDAFVGAIDVLLRQDRDWAPAGRGKSLYLRPLMFATEVGLGIKPSDQYLFLLVASPVGPFFPNGVKPLSVWISADYTRAAPGGTGEVKCSGNYAATLVAQADAAQRGCEQVVWLDVVERRWVEEMGGMNIVFVYGRRPTVRLVTPALTGTLLPGVTRDSLLTLARDLGYATEERPVSVEEWQTGCADGSITEAFACGTAAIVTPIGLVMSERAKWPVGHGEPGPITMQLRDALLDIQHGAAEDRHGWMHQIC